MLIECAKYVERHGGNPRNLTQMNLLLHGLADHRVEKGDTIRDPKLVQDGGLILYDRVIAHPPFSLDVWGAEVAQGDPFGLFHSGIMDFQDEISKPLPPGPRVR